MLPNKIDFPYEIKIANDKEIAICQELRYLVYCAELGYEPLRAEQREVDAEDAWSDHILLQRRDTGAFVGCMRVIHPQPGRPLPCMTHVPMDPLPAWMEQEQPCEISRLALLKNQRSQSGQEQKDARLSALILLAGFAIFLHCTQQHLVFLAKPSMGNFIHGLGVPLEPVGPAIEFRGIRQVYSADRQGFRMLLSENFQIMEYLYASFYPSDPILSF